MCDYLFVTIVTCFDVLLVLLYSCSVAGCFAFTLVVWMIGWYGVTLIMVW